MYRDCYVVGKDSPRPATMKLNRVYLDCKSLRFVRTPCVNEIIASIKFQS